MADNANPSASSSAGNQEDPADPQLRSMFKVLRILIVGRANAGKTTILQKLCNSTEDPMIFDSKGNQVSDYCCLEWFA